MKLYHLHEDSKNMPVRELDLDVRSTNVFKANNVNTVGDIERLGVDGMLSMKNMGRTSVIYVCSILQKLGIELEGARELKAQRDREGYEKRLDPNTLRDYIIIARKATDMGFDEEIYKVLDDEALRLFGRSVFECVAAKMCVACGMQAEPDEIFMLTGLCWHHQHTDPFPGRPVVRLE